MESNFLFYFKKISSRKAIEEIFLKTNFEMVEELIFQVYGKDTDIENFDKNKNIPINEYKEKSQKNNLVDDNKKINKKYNFFPLNNQITGKIKDNSSGKKINKKISIWNIPGFAINTNVGLSDDTKQIELNDVDELLEDLIDSFDNNIKQKIGNNSEINDCGIKQNSNLSDIDKFSNFQKDNFDKKSKDTVINFNAEGINNSKIKSENHSINHSYIRKDSKKSELILKIKSENRSINHSINHSNMEKDTKKSELISYKSEKENKISKIENETKGILIPVKSENESKINPSPTKSKIGEKKIKNIVKFKEDNENEIIYYPLEESIKKSSKLPVEIQLKKDSSSSSDDDIYKIDCSFDSKDSEQMNKRKRKFFRRNKFFVMPETKQKKKIKKIIDNNLPSLKNVPNSPHKFNKKFLTYILQLNGDKVKKMELDNKEKIKIEEEIRNNKFGFNKNKKISSLGNETPLKIQSQEEIHNKNETEKSLNKNNHGKTLSSNNFKTQNFNQSQNNTKRNSYINLNLLSSNYDHKKLKLFNSNQIHQISNKNKDDKEKKISPIKFPINLFKYTDEKNAKLTDIGRLEEKVYFLNEINHPKSQTLNKFSCPLINSIHKIQNNTIKKITAIENNKKEFRSKGLIFSKTSNNFN